MQVLGLDQALEGLLDRELHPAVSKIRWPCSVLATVNFSRYAAVAASSHGRLRLGDNLVMLQDCSLVLISQREAEYLLRADRLLRQQGKSMIAAVTNLAFVRWRHPAALVWTLGRSARSFSPILPQHALGASMKFESSAQYDCIARNVVATQLFNGETDFEHQDALAGAAADAGHSTDQGKERKGAVCSLLFVSTEDGQADTTGAMAGTAKQLVQARQRSVFWEGSCLEALCKEAIDRQLFREAPQRVS